MHRHLMTATALVAASMLAAGGAVAADKKMKAMKPSISVNGYYEGVVGGILDETLETNGSATPNTDTTALDTRTDAEIHFNGRTALDNGMKIHARVELEGQNHHSHDRDNASHASRGGDPVDEYFLSVSGSFGKIILGGTGGAPVKMLTGFSGSWATGVGETLSFDNAWVPSAAPGGQHFYVLQHSRLDTGDAEKITYISPKFGGFSIGATYSPTRKNHDDNGRNNTMDGAHDGFEAAASYSGKFGDVSFGIGGGMTAYQGAEGASDAGLNDWLIAARLDFGGGFRVSAAHKQVNNDDDMTNGQLTDVGVRFVTGANSFSLVGSHGEMEEGDAFHTALMGSYARAMGPGVKTHLNVIWNSSENTDGSVENSGTALVSGIKVVF